jgi:hypothetical protein
MSSDTREEFPHQFLSCHWPQEFKSRRKFPRQIENEPFIEHCQRRQFPPQRESLPCIEHLKPPPDKNGDDRGIDSSDIFENNSHEIYESEGDDSEDDDSEEDEDDDGIDEEEIQYGDEKKEIGESQNYQGNDKNGEAWNSRSAIRKFMEGFVGDEEALSYPDQVEKVVSFCEQGSSIEPKKYVAMLNDTNDGGTGPKKKPYCRPYKGPLTAQMFRHELEKEVLRPNSSDVSQ